MIGLVRRWFAWVFGAPRAINTHRKWTHPSSVITQGVELSLELDDGLVRPGNLRLERAFQPPPQPQPAASPEPVQRSTAVPASQPSPAAATPPPVPEAAAEREEPRRRPGQAA